MRDALLFLAVILKFQERPKSVNVLLPICVSSYVITLFSFFVHLLFALLVSFLLIYNISINCLYLLEEFSEIFLPFILFMLFLDIHKI